MEFKPSFDLVLRGGLGNQLFQIAAALTLANDRQINILDAPGSTRNTRGITDILHFELPRNLQFVDPRFNRFIHKLLSVNLKIGMLSHRSRFYARIAKPIGVLSDCFFTVFFRRATHLLNATDVGYFKLNARPSRNLLNGYFQSVHWANQMPTLSKLEGIKLVSESERLRQLIALAKIDRPIIVHIRLGDYKNEPGIGVLNSNYFKNALTRLESLTSGRKVWIFSDEPQSININETIPEKFQVTLIEDPSLSPAETLELMRHGSAYVISNSTFSWWAAFLSFSKEPPTIMPTPWFKEPPSPTGIKPAHWIEIGRGD